MRDESWEHLREEDASQRESPEEGPKKGNVSGCLKKDKEADIE